MLDIDFEDLDAQAEEVGLTVNNRGAAKCF